MLSGGASEIAKVSQVFQPEARFAASVRSASTLLTLLCALAAANRKGWHKLHITFIQP